MTTELKLTFTRRGKGWEFVLAPNWGGQPSAPAPFRSPLVETEQANDYEDLRWYLEEYMDYPYAGNVVRAADVERRLEGWGLDLYRQLFEGGGRVRYLDGLLKKKGPRLLSIASLESDILRVPWELLRVYLKIGLLDD
jgi:hypothetical protein